MKTTKEWKKIARILKKVYKELEEEALKNGINTLSDEYQVLMDKARLSVLEKFGWTLDEYRKLKEEISGVDKISTYENLKQTDKKIDEVIDYVNELHIPDEEEIAKIAEKIAKKYVVPPVIKKEIVKEYTIEKPKIIETVRVKKEKYDDTKIKKEIKGLFDKINDIKLPEPLDSTQIKNDLFDALKKDINEEIDLLGMPDFRKLGMGLQGQIDDLRTYVDDQVATVDTLAEISGLSDSTAKSLYTMTTGVPVEFESSDNNTLLYLDETNERIGIGTTNPSAKLEIASGALDFSGSASVGTAQIGLHSSNFLYVVGGTAGLKLTDDGLSGITVLDGGNVGIGTTSPNALLQVGSVYNSIATVTPKAIISSDADTINSLHLENSSTGTSAEMRFISKADDASYVAFTQPGSGNTGSFFGLTKSTGSFLFSSARDLVLGTIGDDDIKFGYGNDTIAMTIEGGTGNVGIGTTSPGSILEISGSDSTEALLVKGQWTRLQSPGGEDRINFLHGNDGNNAIIEVYDNTEASKVKLHTSGDSWLNGGNVGIGTTSPGSKLEISDNSPYVRFTEEDYSNKQWQIGGYSSGLTMYEVSADSHQMYIDAGGNVGIGTTSPIGLLSLNETPSYHPTTPTLAFGDGDTGFFESSDDVLDISVGGGNIFRFSGGTIISGAGAGSLTLKRTVATSTDPIYSFANDVDTGIGWAGADILSLIAGGTNGLNVIASGNVGIGTTSPESDLHVSGLGGDILKIEGSGTSGWLQFDEGASIRGYFGYGDDNALFTGASTDSLALRANSDLHLGGGGNNLQMTLDGSGVGIGTTNPTRTLDITGNVLIEDSIDGGNLLYINNTNANGFGVRIDVANLDNNKYILDLQNSSGSVFYARNDGNVGIGTTSPIAPSHIDKAGGSTILQYFQHSGSSDGDKEVLGYLDQGGASTWTIKSLNVSDTGASADFSINTRGAGDAFVVKDSGNVGIGTTSPSSILHINGGTGSLATGLAFGDGDTGFYESADDVLQISVAGTTYWEFSSDDFRNSGGSSVRLSSANPTATTPNIMPTLILLGI